MLLAVSWWGCRPAEPAPESTPVFDCEDFVVPQRTTDESCDDPDDPRVLGECPRGSGFAGSWRVDGWGLPAYELTVDHRCDPAGQHWSPRPRPQGDPLSVVGNGRGVLAMARGSGAIELYTQDRGHQWVDRADDWQDPENPDWPVQLGGGFSYVVEGDGVRSTRFDDLGTNEATEIQRRWFGVGYARTSTSLDGLRVDRVTFAPDGDARALVAEVTVANLEARPRTLGLVEVWDVNRSQVDVALLTSDLAADGLTDELERHRRELQRGTVDTVAWSRAERIATVHTDDPDRATADRATPATVDEWPDDLFLAVLGDDEPDAVWLADDELWDGPERPVPAGVARAGSAADRSVERDGWGQRGLLAVRVPVELPPYGTHTARFAFGLAPGGSDPRDAVASLRAEPDLLESTERAWADRLVWASFPGLPEAGALQRELAWSTYATLANATFDEYHGVRVVGQGGSYRFIHGLDGAIGDLALFAEPLSFVDPALAADTLHYALATQRAAGRDDAGRFPYATTGVGNFSDVGLYTQRSDAYFLLPWRIAGYVADTRDRSFLDRVVPYWPKADGDSGTVLDHLSRTEDYAEQALGIGAGGLVAIGTGDYADGVLNLTDAPTSPTGTSSTYNAGFVVNGFGLVADVLADADPALSARARALEESQRAAYADAWLGDAYARGFADDGSPMAPDLLFLEPQVLAMLAEIPDEARTEQLVEEITTLLETPYGAISTASLSDDPEVGGIDQPQIGGVWPVANAWWTEALARRDADAGWDSLVRNTLSAHARAYPELWYGIWTGPDSFYGPDADRPGEADAHLATALTDYPALNAHLHTSPLRALLGVLGVRGTAAGLRIDPRVPTESWSVDWPRLTLWSTPDAIGGAWTPVGGGPAELAVTVPSGLRSGDLRASVDGRESVVEATDGVVILSVELTAGQPLAWSIAR